jgi:hypothetical protein
MFLIVRPRWPQEIDGLQEIEKAKGGTRYVRMVYGWGLDASLLT